MMIRRATMDDLEAMGTLLCELFAVEDDFTIDVAAHRRGLALLIQNENAAVPVALSGEKIVGMATMQPLVSTAVGGNVGLIEDVIVTESYRGRGIGRILLEELIAESRRRGYRRIALAADRRNGRAIAFYRRYGFVPGNMGMLYRLD